jgi:hypothetical protein
MSGNAVFDRLALRRDVLESCGAAESEIDELLRYNESSFEETLSPPIAFPLEDEPFVAAWERYLREASTEGVLEVLRRALVQLQFPIQAGISQNEAYLAATRRGVHPPPGWPGLTLSQPERLSLTLHPTPAGRIPVLVTGDRKDFVALVRALSRRNEPAPVPDTMGACVIAGFNNWDRVREFRRKWEATADSSGEADWQEEFKRIVPRRELYQDRFLILSDGPYSAVSADALGLSSDEWRRLSLIVRREHESAHYFTRRVFSSMKNNLIDELIADYMGLVGGCGSFRADWFLHFMGLERFPEYRAGGRLENYRGDPQLSPGSFIVLQRIVVRAAKNLERFDQEYASQLHTDAARPKIMMTLTGLKLEELAAETAGASLAENFERRLNSAGQLAAGT